jgi:hypothetical protein
MTAGRDVIRGPGPNYLRGLDTMTTQSARSLTPWIGSTRKATVFGVIAPFLPRFRATSSLDAAGDSRAKSDPKNDDQVDHLPVGRRDRGNQGAANGPGRKGFQVPAGCASRSAMTHSAGA